MVSPADDGIIGTAGREVLYADLTSGAIRRTPLDPALEEVWTGGRGLAGAFIRPFCTLSWDDPAMPFVLAAGPLAGTPSPSSGMVCAMCMSPLTGTVGDASAGGSFASGMACAGLAAVVITGRSPGLAGLEIEDGSARLVDAWGLAGRDTAEISRLLRGRGSSVVTGPAADNGVLYANIVVDGRYAAGRNGLGLCLASRNLKYVTVKGSGRPRVADPARLSEACADISRLFSASPVLMGGFGFHNMGTGALYDLMHARGMMPTANFRRTSFEPAPGMNAPAYARLLGSKRAGCGGCPIKCRQTGRGGVHVPGFEAMSHFSALVENDDISVVLTADDICMRLGMDATSAGSTLACHAEIEERRLAPSEMLDLLRAVGAGREGGLGMGSRRYAEMRGRPDSSMTVKGLELPACDPRGACGMALAYAVATSGGCYMRAYPISHEILRKPVATDRFSFAGKARIIKIAEDANAAMDSIGACRLGLLGATLEEFAGALSAVSGIERSAQDLLDLGERVTFRDRIMNGLRGFTADDDDLPARFFEEPGTPGPWPCLPPVPRDGFLDARARYYRIRGLAPDGSPLPEKAQALGLPSGA
ncbi:MAG TPA: aldehyde ferredoxin oxidoreductase C-terminal domain-containing protein [Candidatus Fermentibacter daniensis]|jgi:aldehyde:ferredoxin oxidoreductase|nr:MAG: hypothetical protein AO395_03790 [Candidatus Fermentibacter daniensis]MBP7719460.1 hypothetical protein [Candidatus Fermentibacter sp.]KZD18728.1 MAG: hypothetical protein AO396_00300 [Candidatus Fermentibacter daniensis]MCC6870755.1 hypothetical protein [Candidatus Fermentibacter sp.]NLI01952.1 aldehyde ferredoxin oxidoreductase [Candidatus Fermentibacter daniensis]